MYIKTLFFNIHWDGNLLETSYKNTSTFLLNIVKKHDKISFGDMIKVLK